MWSTWQAAVEVWHVVRHWLRAQLVTADPDDGADAAFHALALRYAEAGDLADASCSCMLPPTRTDVRTEQRRGLALAAQGKRFKSEAGARRWFTRACAFLGADPGDFVVECTELEGKAMRRVRLTITVKRAD